MTSLSTKVRKITEDTAKDVKGVLAKSAVAAALGAFSDFLTPLTNVQLFLFVASGVATILLTGVFFFTKGAWARRSYHFSALVALVSGGFWVVQTFSPEAKSAGVIASNVAALSAIQKDLGIVSEKVALIEKRSARIDDVTQKTAQDVRDVKESVEKVSALGGLVSNPTSFADFYHNARIMAQRGELDMALKQYERGLDFKAQTVDWAQDFIATKIKASDVSTTRRYLDTIKEKLTKAAYYVGIVSIGQSDKNLTLSIIRNEFEATPAVYLEYVKRFFYAYASGGTVVQRNSIFAAVHFSGINDPAKATDTRDSYTSPERSSGTIDAVKDLLAWLNVSEELRKHYGNFNAVQGTVVEDMSLRFAILDKVSKETPFWLCPEDTLNDKCVDIALNPRIRSAFCPVKLFYTDSAGFKVGDEISAKGTMTIDNFAFRTLDAKMAFEDRMGPTTNGFPASVFTKVETWQFYKAIVGCPSFRMKYSSAYNADEQIKYILTFLQQSGSRPTNQEPQATPTTGKSNLTPAQSCVEEFRGDGKRIAECLTERVWKK